MKLKKIITLLLTITILTTAVISMNVGATFRPSVPQKKSYDYEWIHLEIYDGVKKADGTVVTNNLLYTLHLEGPKKDYTWLIYGSYDCNFRVTKDHEIYYQIGNIVSDGRTRDHMNKTYNPIKFNFKDGSVVDQIIWTSVTGDNVYWDLYDNAQIKLIITRTIDANGNEHSFPEIKPGDVDIEIPGIGDENQYLEEPEETPTPAPTVVPTPAPTATPTPTAVPTAEPTAEPTATPAPTTVPTVEPVEPDESEGEIVNLRVDTAKKMAVRFENGKICYNGDFKKVVVGKWYPFQICSVNWDNGTYDDNGNGLCGTVVYRVKVVHKDEFNVLREIAIQNPDRYTVKGMDIIDNYDKTIVINCDADNFHLETDVNNFFMAYRFHFTKGDYNKQTGIKNVVNPIESLSVNLPLGTTVTADAYINFTKIADAAILIENSHYTDVYLTSVNDYTWNY